MLYSKQVLQLEKAATVCSVFAATTLKSTLIVCSCNMLDPPIRLLLQRLGFSL